MTTPAVPQSISSRPVNLCSPTEPYDFISPNSTWSTANNAASLASASRADQLTQPTDNITTGEYAFDPNNSICLFKFLLRGASAAIARGHVLTAQLWEWSCVRWPGHSTYRIFQWTPTLVGRWTFTFNGTGNAALNTVGVANGVVLDTDIYASNIVVVATYDRRGDYALRWKILQPSADDGSPAVLMVDGLGSNRFTWEGRTTTNGDAFHILARHTSAT